MGSLSVCKDCLRLQGLGFRVQGLHGGSYPPDISLDDLPPPPQSYPEVQSGPSREGEQISSI